MKTILLSPAHVERLLARFGAARLVKHLNGHVELRGGNRDDRQAAREWVAFFLHESSCELIPRRG